MHISVQEHLLSFTEKAVFPREQCIRLKPPQTTKNIYSEETVETSGSISIIGYSLPETYIGMRGLFSPRSKFYRHKKFH